MSMRTQLALVATVAILAIGAMFFSPAQLTGTSPLGTSPATAQKDISSKDAEVTHKVYFDVNINGKNSSQERQLVYELVKNCLADFTDEQAASRPLSERAEMLLGLRPYSK